MIDYYTVPQYYCVCIAFWTNITSNHYGRGALITRFCKLSWLRLYSNWNQMDVLFRKCCVFNLNPLLLGGAGIAGYIRRWQILPISQDMAVHIKYVDTCFFQSCLSFSNERKHIIITFRFRHISWSRPLALASLEILLWSVIRKLLEYKQCWVTIEQSILLQ